MKPEQTLTSLLVAIQAFSGLSLLIFSARSKLMKAPMHERKCGTV